MAGNQDSGRTERYGWSTLALGEALFLQVPDRATFDRVRSACYQFAARRGLRFSCKRAEGVLRVQRLG